MISRWLPFTLLIVVFAPGLLQAQTPANGPSTVLFNQFEVRDFNNDKMYEDIEIFRRILGRELQPLYPRVNSSSVIGNPFTSTARAYPTDRTLLFFYEGNTSSDPGSAPILSSLEGVYLKGVGVVYTATLATLQPPARPAADSTVGRVLRLAVAQQESEWDNVRRQVRNEKEKPKKVEARKAPSLSDVLLTVLAENGHNFSQLGENENLTLVLTVHESSPSSASPKSGTGPAGAQFKAATSNTTADLRSQPRDLELLGELHFKQGKYDEAIEVFQRAMGRTESTKLQAELLRKLAQCHLMQGQDEKARNDLDKAIIIMKKETEAQAKCTPATKPTAALPVKLIISAPKKLLDQVKGGKITFEEFRRQAHVEMLRFDERR
jgi:tetratricopeptide (TPR) repeat protein